MIDVYATTSFKGRKQIADVKQQVILQEHKFYINEHEYFCPLRAARHSFSPQVGLRLDALSPNLNKLEAPVRYKRV